jgi:hypothetical protein
MRPLYFVLGARAAQFPDCAEKDVILRHNGEHALFADLALYGKSYGCFLDDCTYSDKFVAVSDMECAALCAQLPECNFWSTGEEEGEQKCWLRESDGGKEALAGALSGTKACAPPEYPDCVEKDFILRGAGMYAVFVDATRFQKTSGCFNDDCTSTDKFTVESQEECSRVCATVDECTFWTHGTEDGVQKCWLRNGDGGKEASAGFVAGSKFCAPPDAAQAAVPVEQGNPACWVGGFSYELCCSGHYGQGGNAVCWDGTFTYDKCCFRPEL